jgi:hypothetical protein
MSKFVVEFECDNAAFMGMNETWEGHFEIARILKSIASEVENNYNLENSILDYNGNLVGSYRLKNI